MVNIIIGVEIIEEVTKFNYLVLVTAQQVVNTNRVIGSMNGFVWNSMERMEERIDQKLPKQKNKLSTAAEV